MDAALSGYLFQPSIIASLLAGASAVAAAATGAAFAIPKIATRIIPKPKQTRLADHMKFLGMEADGRTIICEDGTFAVVLHVVGTDLKFNEAGQQAALNKARQSWLEQMNEMDVRVREFFIRDRLPKATDFINKFGIMREVAQVWNAGLPRALSTEFYIVLTLKDAKKGVARLKEAILQTKSVLVDYHVNELVERSVVPKSIKDEDGQSLYLEETLTPSSFFARMLSPITRPQPMGIGRNIPLSYRMCSDVVRYDSDLSMIEFSNGPSRKYAAMLVIEEWSSPIFESHMFDLLSFPVEMTVCHDIVPVSKGKAMATIGWQGKMASGLQIGSDSYEQFTTVGQALERGAEEEQELFQCQTTILIYGDTPAQVTDGYQKVLQMKIFGVTPIWAKHSAIQQWFGQFPGFDAMARPQRMLSGEVSILSTFQNTPVGSPRSDWGEGPIAMFETLDGSPYSFQWHVAGGNPPLGHCVVIGPSSSGKTTLITYLAAMSLRHSDVKAYFFDRGRGCEVITKALGGSYLFFDGEEKSVALNPMQLDDTGQNRSFLNEWLQLVAQVKPDEYALQKEISEAIEINFDPNLSIEHRNLKQLFGSAFSANTEMRERLMAWTNPAQFGTIVCADYDTLDISQRVAGFDFTNILGDVRLGPAMVSYLMHRILAEAKGQPRLVFIDETEALLKDPNFQIRFRKLLQEGRKERQVIVSCFQRPQAPEDVGVGDTVRGQCPTVFFFKNNAAQPQDYASWNLTPRELDFVMGRTYKRHKYAVLIKRYTDTPESVILNVDLSALGKWMKIFQSGRPQVLKMEEMQAKYGADFLRHYLDA